MIESLDVDDDGYPSETALEHLHTRLKDASPADLHAFMWYDFVRLARELPYAVVVVDPDPVLRIEFATGGWSGCEDFINTVLSRPLLRLLYYAEWKRGGLHVFEVPKVMEP